jgi:hypothetical protein
MELITVLQTLTTLALASPALVILLVVLGLALLAVGASALAH